MGHGREIDIYAPARRDARRGRVDHPPDSLDPRYIGQGRRRHVIPLLSERDIDRIEARDLDLDQELALGRRRRSRECCELGWLAVLAHDSSFDALAPRFDS